MLILSFLLTFRALVSRVSEVCLEYVPRCPYDGFRMVVLDTENFGKVGFGVYKCSNCGHLGVVAFEDGEPETEVAVLGCPCVGCKRERVRTGSDILKE